MFCTLQLLIGSFTSQPFLTLFSICKSHFHDTRWQTWALIRQPQYLLWLEDTSAQLFKPKQILKKSQERGLHASNGRFFCKSEQHRAAQPGWPWSCGCDFLMQGVQWQCWFQLFSQSLVPITELTFLGRIFFFFFNRIRSLIQFKIQSCKQLCCHNWMGWRPADRTQETESGRQRRYEILRLHWVYGCFLFLMPAAFCFFLHLWVKA